MMTKPELQEKLIRKPTSLPPRISSYGPIVGNNNGNNNSKWNEFICKFIHALSTIIQFCSPLVIMMAILYDSIIVTAVAFGLFLLKILVLDLFLFKVGKIQNWPNKLDMIAVTVFASSALLGFVLSRRTNIQFRGGIITGIVVYGLSIVIVAIGWLFGRPIGQIFLSDKVEDTIPYTHPVVIHFIQLTSGAMMSTLFVVFIVHMFAGVYYDRGERETASALILFGFTLLDGMVFFTSCYGFYFNTNIVKIAAKYEKEINQFDIIIFSATVLGLSAVHAVFGFGLSRTNIQFRTRIITGIVVYGLSTVIVAIGWLFGHPIGRFFSSDKVEDTVAYTHPVVIHFIKMISETMMVTYLLTFLVFIAAKNFNDQGEKEKAFAALLVGHITSRVMIFFISCYSIKNLNTNIEKTMNKHHPNNHEMTKLEIIHKNTVYDHL